MSSTVSTPLSIANGRITLQHRVIMAPMTRNRGVPLTEGTSEKPNRGWLPDDLVALYYAQRASKGGLLITEGIPPSLKQAGCQACPLWHAGRATIPHMTGSPTLSAFATPWDDDEKFPFRDPVTKEKISYKDHPPQAMSLEDMDRTVADFVTAARTAIEVGFDGVEINGGNGNYAYGGSPEKRARFPLDLLSAVASAIGPSNVGIRLEPTGIYNHTRGTERVETWAYLCSQTAHTYVGKDRLSYVHFIEPRLDRIDSQAEKDGFYRNWSLREVSNLHFRQILDGTPVFTCGDWGSGNFEQALERGWDAVAFAKWFVSNPDLPARLMNGAPLHHYDRSRFDGSWDGVRETGYVDYPTFEDETIVEHGQVTEK